MRKVLSVVGTTASGKTRLALDLARLVVESKRAPGALLLSADSRQVYRGLEVLTGADIPSTFSRENSSQLPGYFRSTQYPTIQLHGVSCIEPDQPWSVADFQRFALPLITQALDDEWLVVVVGGTGLYHRHLFNAELVDRPGPNQQLRDELSTLTVGQLQQRLSELSSQRFEALNHSDKHNPRRLIRHIELEMSGSAQVSDHRKLLQLDQHYLGLHVPIEKVVAAITERVARRFDDGLEEVRALQASYSDQELSLFSSMGVAELHAFDKGEIDEIRCRQLWAQREVAYAKRQLTWWRGDQKVRWVDPASIALESLVSEFC